MNKTFLLLLCIYSNRDNKATKQTINVRINELCNKLEGDEYYKARVREIRGAIGG